MVLMLFISNVSCCACVIVFDTFVYMLNFVSNYDRTTSENEGFVTSGSIGGFSTKREYTNAAHISIQYHI
jgi:hypothetical protein